MPNFSILLPPAEGKKPGGNPFAPDMFDYRSSTTFNYFHDLNPERRQLINALQNVVENREEDVLREIFGVKGDYLEEAIRVNSEIYTAPLMSALDRYSLGVMYKAMDFAGLPTGAQRRLLENGIIFSGLFGLLRPDDLIPNYRLRMEATLPEIGRMAKYWKPFLSPVLNETLKGRFVWDLLPAAHRDAWDDDHSYAQLIRVKFYVEEGGERKAVSHNVKPLRGQLVNFIVRETVEELEPFLAWEHPAGYRYDEAASSFNEETKTGVVAMVKKA
ncbi:MAG: YaaA family protein [Rhodothermales bacterium]